MTRAFLLLFLMAAPGFVTGQTATSPPQAQVKKDLLGRTTPRGAVLGFLAAARKGEFSLAVQYLNTRERGPSAATLAQQLYIVLNRRLPARLTQINDEPEGSQSNAADPTREFIGTIRTATGQVDVLLERLEKRKEGPIWLFSAKTLEQVPDLYLDTEKIRLRDHVPAFLGETYIFGIALIEWLALVAGIPLVYYVTALLNRFLSWLVVLVRRRFRSESSAGRPVILAIPVRLVLVAITINILLTDISLPLIARSLWSVASVILITAALIWGAIRMTGIIERFLVRRFKVFASGVLLLHFMRRAVDALLVVVCVLLALRYMGVNTTAALAGLGVGGIAIALAAQKTLENVIGGLSLIFDRTLNLGDTLKINDTAGTVEAIGLRSTWIRTPDRTVVSVPNGQVATVSLENISARDKIWFHPVLKLEYTSTAAQIRQVLQGIEALLRANPVVEPDSCRVRLVSFGVSSLELEIFAYLRSTDWGHFLVQQQELLLSIMDVVEQSGARIALPSQALHLLSSPAFAVKGDETAGFARQSAS